MISSYPSFASTVKSLGWETFIKHRNSYTVPIVREFYAGIPEPKEGKPQTYSMVRNVRIHFDSKTINDEYDLGYNGPAFKKKVETFGKREMERIRLRIAEKHAKWESFNNKEFKLKRMDLKPEAQVWFNFVVHSVLPTSHTSSLKKESLILLDSILSDADVDIGRIVSKKILNCRNKNAGYLFFPCLITNLCINAGVQIQRGEERKNLPGTLSAEIKGKVAKATASETSMMPQQHMLQQQAVWKFLKNQFEWLKLVFDQIGMSAPHMETPDFPNWVLGSDEEVDDKEEKEEEEEEEEKERKRKGKAVQRPKKVEKAKKKKTIVVEEEFSFEEEETPEDERIVQEVKEMEKNEDKEDSETSEEESEESERKETFVMKKQPKPPTPTKSPTPVTLKSPTQSSPKTTPPATTPPPTKTPTKTPAPNPKPTQQTVIPPKEPIPPSKEQTPPVTKKPTPSPQTQEPEKEREVEQEQTQEIPADTNATSSITVASANISVVAGSKRKLEDIVEEPEKEGQEEAGDGQQE